jgi:pyruvate/2-oxoglutarate dehydrogenase complex dihydrolipoamide dehydrogenase (E3) component
VRSQSETRELEYDKLLLGIGRKANLEDLGLEAAEIRVRDGGVDVDVSLRTSNPAVYAAGDVAFPEKYTHFPRPSSNASGRATVFRACPLPATHRYAAAPLLKAMGHSVVR